MFFSKKLFALFASTVVMTTMTSYPVHSAGRTSQGLANTILSGKGAPSNKIGINGDFYIDIATFNIYGPKASNKWPAPVSLKGPAGVNGADGKAGERGNATSGSRGEQGATGAQGEKGDKGDKGDKGEKGEKGETGTQGPVGPTGPQGPKGDTGAVGATGLTGPAGAKGETGATGLQGPKGDTGATGATGPAGSVGAKGDTGAQGLQGIQGLKGDTGATGATGAAGSAGAKGDTGATGAQGLKGDKGETGDVGPTGAKGDTGATGSQGTKGDKGDTGATGATGATGPSNAYLIRIPNFTLSTTSPFTSAASSSIGNLLSGSSYVFDIALIGKTSADGNFGLSLSATGDIASNNLKYEYTTSYSYEVRNNSPWRGYQFHVIGTLVVGVSDSTLKVSIIDGSGITSGGAAMTISGTAVIRLVGSVSISDIS